MKVKREDFKRVAVLCIAAFLMALNIRTFVRAGGLFPGGVNGLTLLLQRVAERYFDREIPFTVVNLVLNAVPLYIGFRYIGVKFTGYSCLMILLANLLTDALPTYVLTYDTLLVSVFGGLVNGFVISLCLRANATTGGTDFLAIYLSEKKGQDSWNVVLAVNAAILVAAGFLFGWDKALYSIIFQYCSTQTLHLLFRSFQQETLFIITKEPSGVCCAIHQISHHGATIIDGQGAYQGDPRKIVYSVISRADHARVIRAVMAIDAGAFVNTVKTDELQGRFYFKPYE